MSSGSGPSEPGRNGSTAPPRDEPRADQTGRSGTSPSGGAPSGASAAAALSGASSGTSSSTSLQGEGDHDITTTGSRLIYENRWMRLREDTVRRRDGSPGLFGVVEKTDFATVAAIEDGMLHMIEQYRYPVRRRAWEFVQGMWETRPGTDPLVLARAELREETGLEAAEMHYAGRLFLAYGFCTQANHVFLARGLRPGQAALEPEEQDLVTRAIPLAEVERMIRDGVIDDQSTISAFALLRLKGML
ncbi:NUDIX domain-containing protein [Roseomonas elaeocarpi]|uniref:GDP-mannose pyrophosphatase n=1 Tax=Roseomonas elaeocarpi TaxID=907779 RepID=A0ABV6JUG4_9PROT